MYIDSTLEFSDKQALSASGNSTDVVDLGNDDNIGVGDPIYFVAQADEALAGTNPELTVELETSDTEDFAVAETILSSGMKTELAAGDRIVLAMPFENKQFVRAKYTLGGTGPTVTMSAFLTSQIPTTNV